MIPPVAGLLLFDKPGQWTSHDVVAAVRRQLPKDTRVGHTGTLDPLATGLLILLVGRYTRLQGKLQGADKVYSGHIRLGIKTDTGDITGKTIEEKPVPALTLEILAKKVKRYIGIFESVAPAFSAVKHQGKPLYEYARAGIAVPVKPRKCTIQEWTALSYQAPELEHRLACSSGTYVRSLAEALGAELGCGGAVSSLRRESIGPFLVKDAISLEAFKAMAPAALRERIETQASLYAA